MTISTGHTQDLTTQQRIENLTGIAGYVALFDAAAASDGNPDLMERILTGSAMAKVNDEQGKGIKATMLARRDEIAGALLRGFPTAVEANALLEELTEITNYLARENLDDVEDIYQVRSEMKRNNL